MESEEKSTPATLVTYGGGETAPIGLQVYLSQDGMVTLRFDEESWVQMSPIVAKQFAVNVREVIQEAAESMSGS